MLGKGDLICQKLLNDIRSGVYLPGEKLPGSQELATRYGVAHLTMRRVLERLRASGQIYPRNRVGWFVAPNSFYQRVTLVLDTEEDRHSVFLKQLQVALVNVGCIMNVTDAFHVAQYPDMFVDSFRIAKDFLLFDGATFFPWELLDRVPKETRRVVFHRYERERLPEFSSALSDYEDAGFRSMAALIRAGKTRLAALMNGTVHQPYSVADDYVAGCRRAAAENGLPEPQILLVEDFHDARLERLLKSGKFDGMASIMDYFLVPVVQVARRLKLDIPDDIAFVSHYNTPWAEEYDLTSADIQAPRIIRGILRLLQTREPAELKIPAKLIYRGSCPDVAEKKILINPRKGKEK